MIASIITQLLSEDARRKFRDGDFGWVTARRQVGECPDGSRSTVKPVFGRREGIAQRLVLAAGAYLNEGPDLAALALGPGHMGVEVGASEGRDLVNLAALGWVEKDTSPFAVARRSDLADADFPSEIAIKDGGIARGT